jgi:hypothetical protein
MSFPNTPKAGTLERLVLEKLVEVPAGITFLDFPPEVNMTDEKLAEAISNLRSGMFESEQDDQISFDA